MSRETTNTLILITDGVEERDLGLVTDFCHPNKVKMEDCDALSPLHQCDSSEPSVVAVGRYSNTPYIPQGMIHSLYLDVGSMSGCITSAQFPLDSLCLCWLLSISTTEVLLPCEVGGRGVGDIPPSPRVPMGWLGGGTPSFQSHLPVSSPANSSFTIGRRHSDQGRVRLSSH